jgi:undecaprenyl-diphosphatase
MALAVRRAAQLVVATLAAVLVIVVCTTRIVLGVHWVSDVLGGVLLALTVLAAASAVQRRRTIAVQ